ncbi:tRNA (N(6)-L-threonylcarbamoyladenosine(37)-C(2))-methylthiotransferase [Methanoplanus endosymbiosus]|uniref:tRNA-t(6)A37 methylthiotransferase n=1 Tax=Methanoplanus endosymbiosus TaxID=33865 RepID=A0A9E7TGL2_9EURY|nr:tRNA (N(6)-L-threonylcarbamoyladenosine(37)-C(2))-methylthiotransferase [Methanoplanus endosymbiosus]UUX91347.1 tRNA (N(6)-L-threonylcarbamoyladenosine(37)-C(2))-methylthiotransferase [Methanoplanus endosymbiosus]
MEFLRERKVHFETYGCTFNYADTGKLMDIALSQGCTVVPADEAETVVINTCTVVAQTERAMIRAIQDYSDREVIVTGCMPVVQSELLRSVRPDLRIILPEEIYRHSDRIGHSVDGGVGIVQMGTGCLGCCTYCITRSARGELNSNSVADIVSETEKLVSEGVHEIQLTGQDVSAYGYDCGVNLGILLKAMAEVEGDFEIRVGMMNPKTILPYLDEITDGFLSPKVFKFVHIPVQSGSDKVLYDMKRGYTSADFERIVAEFRKKIPDIRVSTDLIVGFPGETDEDFKETLEMVKRVCPTKVNITRFSVRENTPAAEYKDMPDWMKKERSRALTVAVHEIYNRNNESLIGKVIPVSVTEKKKAGTVIARDRSYNNIVVMGDHNIGESFDAEITGHRTHYLIGEKI